MVIGYAVKIIRKIGRFIKSLFKGLWNAFDIRDIFVFGGLGMLGYGLYLKWGQWLAFMVCGVLLMTIGYLMRDK
ncbi:hypothetical protein [Methanothrix soehngenii]|uniref:hypothetical protein n=1 Tax=Methanothrix soehngenii TaxID=2223 RepID=UPI002A35F056|nr:hypothetical protein [Methanothrix soehngenii]MDY0412836.1 hypothetical protein [Methanothrix soehngenii]